MLRTHWTKRDPAQLWQTYVQLTEAEAAFRTLKSEVKVRPIWHWTAKGGRRNILNFEPAGRKIVEIIAGNGTNFKSRAAH